MFGILGAIGFGGQLRSGLRFKNGPIRRTVGVRVSVDLGTSTPIRSVGDLAHVAGLAKVNSDLWGNFDFLTFRSLRSMARGARPSDVGAINCGISSATGTFRRP